MTKKNKAVKLISRVLAAVMVFSACQQNFLVAAFADSELKLTPKFHENATVEVSGNKVTVTDTSFNDDVWNSKVLFDTGVTLVPGKQYKIEYDLSGKEGVGEFFLCKTESMDARYDDTFSTDSGKRCTTFTAIGDKLYVGMQVGNIGMDNSVTAEISSIGELEISDTPELMKTANCDVTVSGKTVTAVDTSDNNDVWDSKVLFDAGVELVPGKTYEMSINLSGENGVGEFFLCKSADLNNRVDRTFFNTPGAKHFIFTAESDRLLVGMQFGNIGKGNSVGVTVNYAKPFHIEPPQPTVLCDITEDGDDVIIHAIDNGLIDDEIWNSTVLYPIATDLVPGQEYEITFDLSGDTDKVGEVFLNTENSLRWDKHYSRSEAPDGEDWKIFMNEKGKLTMRFVAVDTAAYVGMQLGDIGIGNSVTLKVSKPTVYDRNVALKEGCSFVTTRSDNNIAKITAEDTNAEEGGIWTSKLVTLLGNLLEKGKQYVAKVVTKGYGEFFLLKSDNMDDKYAGVWKNDPSQAEDTWTSYLSFTASDEGEADLNKLYAGMQFGYDGSGNTFEAEIQNLLEKDSTDTINTGIVLEDGVEYTLHIELADFGEGTCIFFTNEAGEKYQVKEWTGDTWFNTNGEHTFTIVGDGTPLYMNAEYAGLGDNKTITVKQFSVVEKTPEITSYASSNMAVAAEEVEEEVVEETVEVVEETVEVVEETVEVVEETVEVVEETVEVVEEIVEVVEEAVNQPVEETAE